MKEIRDEHWANKEFCRKCGSKNVTNAEPNGGWMQEYKCKDCGCVHKIYYGDKMGGQGDVIEYDF